MDRIIFKTTDNQHLFEMPWEWIEKDGLKPKKNDLDSSAKRGTLNGYLYRKRMAQVPDYTLNIVKSLKRSQISGLLFILKQEEYNVTYFDHWAGRVVTQKFYSPPPQLSVKELPVDNNYSNIIYSPFSIEFISYGDVS